MDTKDYEQALIVDTEIPEDIEFRPRIDFSSSIRILNSDQLDQLRLDIQAVSPERQVKVQDYAVLANNLILAKYGKYILHPYTEDEIREKVIAVEPGTKKIFGNTFYSRKYDEKDDLTAETDGARAHTKARFILIDDMRVANSVSSETIDKITSKFGVERGTKILEKLLYLEALTHEIVHLCHPPAHPITMYRWFDETGAYYYERSVLPAKLPPMEPHLTDFYQRLIDKFGDKVHQCYFSEERDPDILSALHKEYRNAMKSDSSFKKAMGDYSDQV